MKLKKGARPVGRAPYYILTLRSCPENTFFYYFNCCISPDNRLYPEYSR